MIYLVIALSAICFALAGCLLISQIKYRKAEEKFVNYLHNYTEAIGKLEAENASLDDGLVTLTAELEYYKDHKGKPYIDVDEGCQIATLIFVQNDGTLIEEALDCMSPIDSWEIAKNTKYGITVVNTDSEAVLEFSK